MTGVRRRRTLERIAQLLTWLSICLMTVGLLTPPANASRQTRVRRSHACKPGPECDYGAAYEHFHTWGNTAPHALGDCTFAAAANWEQIVLGVHASPALINAEFAQAGGSDQAGLTQEALWSYWQQHGIAGVKLAMLTTFETDKPDVQRAVRNYRAMIVELSFNTDHHIGTHVISGELHDAVLAGFTPTGPLVVSWGQTLQMTWAQWRHEALAMWRVQTPPSQPPQPVSRVKA
jgi:hypothetical protein